MPKELILITGATGFIGSHVLDHALKAGYNARLTIRKECQIADLKNLFPTYASQLDFVVVPDITAAGAYDQAIKGVDHVLHLASPMVGKGEDLQRDYIDPAVKGTEAILKAAKDSPSVKRTVIMASILSIMPMGGMVATDIVVKEDSEEHIPVDLSMDFPEGMVGHALKYQTSKILAHQTSLEFIQKEKPGFTLITLHPTFVLGPSLVQKSAEDISGANMLLMQSLGSEKPSFPPALVDVRDVAQSMLGAIDGKVSKSGEEFIINGVEATWEEVVNYVRKGYPEVEIKLVGPFDKAFGADGGKAAKVLGVKWKSTEEIIASVLEQQLALQKRK